MCINIEAIVAQQKWFIGWILTYVPYFSHFNYYFNIMSHHALLDMNIYVSLLLFFPHLVQWVNVGVDDNVVCFAM